MKKTNKEAIIIARQVHNFLTDYAPNHKTNSKATLKSYGMTISLFLEFLEIEKGISPQTLEADNFNRITIEEWLEWLSNIRGNKPQSCNNRLSSLRMFIEYLSNRELTMRYLYPESLMIPFKKTMKTKITGVSRKGIKTLLKIPNLSTKTGRRDLVLMITMYNTAVRISEILALQIENIHLDVEKPYIRVLGKGNKLRSLYLLPKTVSHLRQYMEEFHGEEPSLDSYLFYSRNKGLKGQLNSEAIRKRFKKYAIKAHGICKEVPLNLHPHQIRHAKASHWLEDDINIVQISFLLGHEQLETTMRYLDVTVEQEAKALATLEDEAEQKISKKWKNSTTTNLKKFCGLD